MPVDVEERRRLKREYIARRRAELVVAKSQEPLFAALTVARAQLRRRRHYVNVKANPEAYEATKEHQRKYRAKRRLNPEQAAKDREYQREYQRQYNERRAAMR